MNMATTPETINIVLTDEQISAGAAVLCDCRKPRRIGRNAAINVVEAMAVAAPPATGAPAAVRTWRERIGADETFPLHVPTDVEQAMVAEIAELRAAAAAAGQQPAFRCPTCCAPAGQPCAADCSDAGLAGAVRIAIGMLEALNLAKLPLAVAAAIGVLRCARAPASGSLGATTHPAIDPVTITFSPRQRVTVERGLYQELRYCKHMQAQATAEDSLQYWRNQVESTEQALALIKGVAA
jgi:hypothetical protein